jgi:hypothetical protein
MRRPKRCPHCGEGALQALGYYERWVSGMVARGDIRLQVRRFRCRGCGRTVSLLPAFAQPYRLIRNETIEAFFNGIPNREDVLRREGLLTCYWRRFVRWLPQLRSIVHSAFGRAPPLKQPKLWWSLIVAVAGNLARATHQLVTEWRVTLFGRYHCHRPIPPAGSTHLAGFPGVEPVKPSCA